ncbi:hypothetical protein M885DRAFT_617456 [Pelagophyceae sp. CCMP2097]|nr:hypothetical protein M885DRAFT_617456 [Pelagophyceae sp. CCMP2097]
MFEDDEPEPVAPAAYPADVFEDPLEDPLDEAPLDEPLDEPLETEAPRAAPSAPPPEDAGAEAVYEKYDEKCDPELRASEVGAWRDAWAAAAAKLSTLTMSIFKKPELAGNALSRHVTYRVLSTIVSEGKEDSFDVCRRFSEFEALRSALVSRYTGLILPPIPPKVVNVGSGFSTQADHSKLAISRQRLLALFAERLSALPWLADDAVLRSFVSEVTWSKVLDEADLDKAPVIHADESTTLGRGRAFWYATILRAPPAPPTTEIEKRLNDLTMRLDALLLGHEAAQKAVLKAVVAAGQRTDALSALYDGFGHWRGASARWALDSCAGATERAAATVQAALRGAKCESALDAPAADVMMGAALQWQNLQLGSLREVIAKHRLVCGDQFKAEKQLAALRQQKASGKVSTAASIAHMKHNLNSSKLGGFFGRKAEAASEPLSVDDEIAKAVKAYEDCGALLDQIVKALWYCELERFDCDYAAGADLWARRLFAVQADLARRAAANWDEALEALEPLPPQAAPVLHAALQWDALSFLEPEA